MSGLPVPASDSQRVFAGTGHYLPACCLFKREHSVCLCSSGLQYKPMAGQRASVLQCVSHAYDLDERAHKVVAVRVCVCE